MEPNPPFEPSRTTPQNVLSALDYYYETRDSTGTGSIYDSNYTGTSTDLNDPTPPIILGYYDEVRHVATLARTPGLTTYIDFGPASSWNRLGSDDPSHPEWAIIQVNGSAFTVEIADGVDFLAATGAAGEYQEFAFTPTLDAGSPTDTLWRIVRWREVGSSGPSGP